MKHTKTPWYADTFEEDDIINIRARTGGGITEHVVYMNKAGNDAANAAFIVKACNSHEVLVEALKGLMASISGGKKSCGHDFTCVCSGDKARKALAQVEDL